MSQSPRCRRLKFHKTSPEQERRFAEMGLFCKRVIQDGNSLFRVVSENVFKSDHFYRKVRKQCVDYLTNNESFFRELEKDKALDAYVKNMSNCNTPGGFTEIAAMSHIYKRDFIIIDSDNAPKRNISNGFQQTIHLLHFKEENHFDGLYPKEKMSNHNILDVGVKCQYTSPVGGATYNCYVQKMPPGGPCLVFVQELGQMLSVAREALRPLGRHQRSLSMNQILKQLDYLKETSTHRTKKSTGASPKNDDVCKQHYKSKNFASNKRGKDCPEGDCRDANNNSLVDSSDSGRKSTCDNSYDSHHYGYMEGNYRSYAAINYANFMPNRTDIIAMPLIVEQSDCNGAENGPVAPSASQATPTPAPPPPCRVPSPYFPREAPTPEHYSVQVPPTSESLTSAFFIAHSPMQAPMVHPGSMVPPMMPFPFYCLPPGAFMPPLPPQRALAAPPSLLPLSLPAGVNSAVQRSTAPSGNDLPFNDIPTLRYFFNLGVDWMMAVGVLCITPPALPTLPLQHPHHNYQRAVSQLATDMQNNMSLEDSSNNSGSPPEHKYQGVSNGHFKPNMSKNGNMRNGNPGGRGGANGNTWRCVRRNDNGPRQQNTNTPRGALRYNPRNDRYGSETSHSDAQEREAYVNFPAVALSYPPPPFHPRYPPYPSEGDVGVPNFPHGYFVPSSHGLPEESILHQTPEHHLPNQYSGYLPIPPYPYSQHYNNYALGNLNVPPPEQPPKQQ